MNIFQDTMDTYVRIFTGLNGPQAVAKNLTTAMETNPKIVKQITHGLTIPMEIAGVTGMAIGMSSEKNKVGKTIGYSAVSAVPGAFAGLAIAGKIAKNAKII